MSGDLVTAAEAARLLGIKPETLYAYVSRGRVRAVPAPADPRQRLYARADLDALAARRRARAGHGPAAAGALRWGEPVLESAVSELTPDGVRYRGRPVTQLLADGWTFEATAELLWTGLGVTSPSWNLFQAGLPARSRSKRDFPPQSSAAAAALAQLVAADAIAHPEESQDLETTLATARSLMQKVAAFALPGPPSPAVHAALISIADHELNASTFAARVAASTGATLHHCVLSGLGTISGPMHGGTTDAVEAMIDQGRLPPGKTPPGFGHRLYPDGDPRLPPLMAAAEAEARGKGKQALERVKRLADAGRQAGHAPSVDFGLVAVARALRLPRGAPFALFVTGRLAGWTAHVLEQRQQAFMLRPRARYIGYR